MTKFGLTVAVGVAIGCSLDRTGLEVRIGGLDAGLDAGGDISPVLDAPDALDTRLDVPMDTELTCDQSSGIHRCGNVCVSDQDVTSCGLMSCTPCLVPPNGVSTCDGTSCGVSCNPGFIAQGGACVPVCTVVCDPGAISVTPPGGNFTGDTTGASNTSGSCGGGSAPERVYKLVLTVPSDVFVTTHGTEFDSVLYMRRGCCGAEIACNDNADGRRTSVLSQPALPPGTYYIFVDGATASAEGSYTVDIYATPASANPAEACGRPQRISNMPVSGNTCGYADDYSPEDCLDVTNSGPDAVYYFVLDATTNVSFNTCTGTCIDSVLYTRKVCTSSPTQGSCDDDSCSAAENCADHPTQSRVTEKLEAGIHYLIVDTYPNTPALCGPFAVTPVGVPP